MAGLIDELLAQAYGLQMAPEIQMPTGGGALPIGPTALGMDALAAEAAAPMPPMLGAPPALEAPVEEPMVAPGGIFGTPPARPALPAPVAENPLMGRFNEVYDTGGQLTQTEQLDPAQRPMLRAQPVTMSGPARPAWAGAAAAASRANPQLLALQQRTPRFFDRLQHLQQLRAQKGI